MKSYIGFNNTRFHAWHHLAWHHLALRLDTPNEVDYCRHGGILQFVLRQMTA